MLIRSIRAENFMRFSRLKVLNLPESGLIGIEGPNESGKSTLGEILLFAFFGKTRLAVESPVTNLIRWGAESMSVEVEFSISPSPLSYGDKVESAADYFIFRQIDRYGTNYVKVLKLPGRSEVAAGNLQVAEFIAKSVKFDFQEFQQSFYHDQYETRRLQATQVAFFETASGIRHMREAIEEIQREIEPMEREFSYYQKEIARNSSQIERHARNAAKLPDLEARLKSLQESLDGGSRRTGDLRRKVEELRAEGGLLEDRAKRIERLLDLSIECLPEEVEKLLCEDTSASQRRTAVFEDDSLRASLQSVRSGLELIRDFSREVAELARLAKEERRELAGQLDESTPGGPLFEARKENEEAEGLRQRYRRTMAWGNFHILLGLLSASGGFFFFSHPHSLPGLPQRFQAWLGFLALFLYSLGGAVLCFARAGRFKRARARALEASERLAKESGQLKEADGKLAALLELKGSRDIPLLVSATESCGRQAAQKAQALRQKHAVHLEEGAGKGIEPCILALSKSDRDLRYRLMGQMPKLEKLTHEEEAGLKKLQADKDRTESEIRECQSQASKKEALEEKNHELESSTQSIRTEIDHRLLACRLLEETIASIRGKIGPTLTRFVKSVLPRLTCGRYRDVRVENDLEIKVFSSDKNDFLSIHELSGGTNEALCLALRLAMSQAFVQARTRQAQFVFLDEPFKMMDFERAAETLKILPLLSPDLQQFLVIQPDFSEEERKLFDFLIRTSREETELSTAFKEEDGAREAPLSIAD